MNIRVRSHLSFLLLFLGFTAAAAGLAYVIERRQVAWGLGQQAEAHALCLAAFLRADAAESTSDARARRALAAAQVSSAAGGLTIAWFEHTPSRWRARLLTTTRGLLMPGAPEDTATAQLRSGRLIAQPRPRPDQAYDEVVGYAGIADAKGALRAVVGVTMKDTVSRHERRNATQATLLLAAAAVLGSVVVSEVIVRRTRAELTALTGRAGALARDEEVPRSHPSLIAELDDLDETLAAIDRILADNTRQTRTQLLHSGAELPDEELARAAEGVADSGPTRPGADAPRCVVRRVGGGMPDDFWTVYRGTNGWEIAAARLLAVDGTMSAVQRRIRADAARDHLGGLAESLTKADLWPQLHAVFPLVSAESVAPATEARVRWNGHALLPVNGEQAADRAEAAAASPMVIGTLKPEVLAAAREFLARTPPASLARCADALATLLGEADRGLLVIISPP